MAKEQQIGAIDDKDYLIVDYDFVEYVSNTVYIIWGCVAGGLLIALLVLVYICIRRKRNRDRRRQLTAVFAASNRNQQGANTSSQPPMGYSQGVPAGYTQYPPPQGTQNPGFVGAVQPPFLTGGENLNHMGPEQIHAYNRDQQGTNISHHSPNQVEVTGYSHYPHPAPHGAQNPGFLGVQQPISSGGEFQNQSMAFGAGQAEAGPSNKY